MTVELENKLLWTFVSECQVPTDIHDLLVAGESVKAAYTTARDVAVFTNKRLIVRDMQGIYSLPHGSIILWSAEDADKSNHYVEINLWTHVAHIQIKLNKDADIRKFEKLIAEASLN